MLRKRRLIAAMKSYRHGMPAKTVLNARRVVQWCLLLVIGLWLSACQEKPKVAGEIDPTGIYALVTVDGAKLPAAISHDGAALQVRSGTFTINADGTCGSKVVFVPPSGSEATREVKAVYTREGSQLKMQWEGAGQTVGIVEGDTFTMTNEGMAFVYKISR